MKQDQNYYNNIDLCGISDNQSISKFSYLVDQEYAAKSEYAISHQYPKST